MTHWKSDLVYSTLRPSPELNLVSLWSSPIALTPRMPDTQIFVISTNVNGNKKVNANISNLSSVHQNKP